MDPWSADELLALLKVRSSMKNWFPDLNWELVSRKLSGLGVIRNAEQCKERFEDESLHFNSLSYEKNYRVFNEFEPFYTSENQEKFHVPEAVKQFNKGDKVQQKILVDDLGREKFQESEEMVAKKRRKPGRGRGKRNLRCSSLVLSQVSIQRFINVHFQKIFDALNALHGAFTAFGSFNFPFISSTAVVDTSVAYYLNFS